jgi:hypothetical protein
MVTPHLIPNKIKVIAAGIIIIFCVTLRVIIAKFYPVQNKLWAK